MPQPPGQQKRVEPAVNTGMAPGMNQPGMPQPGPQKRVEVPVYTGVNQPPGAQKRVEPAVNTGMAPGMNQKRIEPLVNTGGYARMEPPVNSPGFFGMISPFSGGPGNYLNSNTVALLPALRGDESPEELRLRDEIVELHGSAKQKYRHGKYLVNGVLFLICMAILCAVGHHLLTVGRYAALDSRITLRRDPLDPERVLISYTASGAGKVGISRQDETRRTEIIEHVRSGETGLKKTFQWRIRGLQTGDVLELTSRDGASLAHRQITVPEINQVARASAGGGGAGEELFGRVLSAITSEPLSGVEVRVRGTDISGVTDNDGYFVLEGVPAGKQAYEISAEGFMRESFQWDAASSDELRLAMSPGLDAGQIRVVLTWKDKPEDLDAHLEGPLPGGERFHISYQDKGDLKSKEFVQLDSDSQHGFGPESITVLGVLPGTYKFFVHDYTNRDAVETTALARSGAEVKVYYGGQTYTFRPDPTRAGNLWNVCEIRISDEKDAQVAALGTFEGKKIEGMGLYEKRLREDRMEWIADSGGSAASEKAVTAALEWLARHQADSTVPDADGSWGKYCLKQGDARCRCEAGAKCDDAFPDARDYASEDYVMATTGLAVLAFQAGGHLYDNDKRFSDNVRRGLDWIVKNQRDNGLLITPTIRKHKGYTYHEKFMYEHGIASFALAEACAVAKSLGRPVDKKYEGAMKRAIRYTIRTQHQDGGWRYQENKLEESDTSVTAWQVLALKSAKESGVTLDDRLVTGIGLLFTNTTNGFITQYQRNINGTEALWGVGMLVRQFLLNQGDSDYVLGAAEQLADIAVTRWGRKGADDMIDTPDFYLWYKCSLAMQQVGGRDWNRWNQVIRDTLIKLQRKEDCRAGSWDSLEDAWGDFGGRIYTTALGALTLQVYYRYATAEERRAGLGRQSPIITDEERAGRRERLEAQMESDDALRMMDTDLGRGRSTTHSDDVLKSMNEDMPEQSLEELGRQMQRRERAEAAARREAAERGETVTAPEPPPETPPSPATPRKTNVLKDEPQPATRRRATGTINAGK